MHRDTSALDATVAVQRCERSEMERDEGFCNRQGAIVRPSVHVAALAHRVPFCLLGQGLPVVGPLLPWPAFVRHGSYQGTSSRFSRWWQHRYSHRFRRRPRPDRAGWGSPGPLDARGSNQRAWKCRATFAEDLAFVGHVLAHYNIAPTTPLMSSSLPRAAPPRLCRCAGGSGAVVPL